MFESLQADQRQRWQRGDRLRVQSYVERYPNLATDIPNLMKLIGSEMALREAAGEAPNLDEYLSLFPQCAEELTKRSTGLHDISLETVTFGTQPTDPSNDLLHSTATTNAVLMNPGEPPSNDVDLETIRQESAGKLLVAHAAEFTGFPKIPGFTILAELGRGGMGIVYRAKQLSANRIVALKVVRNELLDAMPLESQTSTLERFRTEAQAAARLQHDNLVSVYEIGEVPSGVPGGCPLRYYAMRFVDGRSLFDIVRDGPLDNRRAAAYMEPVARALQAAHDQGILHRDLKPHNIMVDSGLDRPLVTDFGLAKFVEGQDALTYAGEIMGTPSYMSPEQAQDAGKVTASADLYSLGATLYHLLTGRAPFQASNIAETIRQIIDKEPVSLRQLNPSVNRDLETICLKCLQKDPARRYVSCAALAEDLHLYLNGRPIIARPVGYLERTWRWCKRNPVPAALTGTAIVLAISTMLSIVVGYRNTTAALAVSESRLQRALEVVDELFTRVSEDELLNEPGMQPLRKDLLEKALKHYQYFLAESGGKEALKDEVAAAHFRVGVISQTLGEFKLAKAELLLALNAQTQLLKEHPNDLLRLKANADTLNALGRLYDENRQFAESAKMFVASTKIRERLVTLQPDNIEFLRLRANSMMNLGLAKVYSGDYSFGVLDMRAAQREREAILKEHPNDKLRRDLAMGWYSLGKTDVAKNLEKTEMAEGEFESAIVHFQEAIEEFRTLLSHDPRSLNNRYYLGLSYRLLGGVLNEKGDAALALESFEAATKTMQSLAAGNPDVTAYQAELAMLAANRGEYYFVDNDLLKSLQAWQEAQSLTRELLAKDPLNPNLKSDLIISLCKLGDLERSSGNILEAKKFFHDARSLAKELLESDTQNGRIKESLSDIELDIQDLEMLSNPQEKSALE